MSEFSWRDFQIWFEGFSENVKGSPNAKQWERIRAQIARIDGAGPPVAKPAKPQLVRPPAPVVPQTQEEYEEETRRLAKGNGPRDGYHDDKYVGASS
jgi:hypothetical protein